MPPEKLDQSLLSACSLGHGGKALPREVTEAAREMQIHPGKRHVCLSHGLRLALTRNENLGLWAAGRHFLVGLEPVAKVGPRWFLIKTA